MVLRLVRKQEGIRPTRVTYWHEIECTVVFVHTPLYPIRKLPIKHYIIKINYFNKKSKDLIRKSDENSLLKDKKPRLS